MGYQGSVVSRNTDYAAMLAKKIRALPAKAMRNVLYNALWQVSVNTVQDSGNAAMNWNVTKGHETAPAFQILHGIGAVGYPNEKRSGSGNIMAVVNAQTRRFLSEYPIESLMGENTMTISNKISNPHYEKRARVTFAGVSVTQYQIDRWMKEAINA